MLSIKNVFESYLIARMSNILSDHSNEHSTKEAKNPDMTMELFGQAPPLVSRKDTAATEPQNACTSVNTYVSISASPPALSTNSDASDSSASLATKPKSHVEALHIPSGKDDVFEVEKIIAWRTNIHVLLSFYELSSSFSVLNVDNTFLM